MLYYFRKFRSKQSKQSKLNNAGLDAGLEKDQKSDASNAVTKMLFVIVIGEFETII